MTTFLRLVTPDDIRNAQRTLSTAAKQTDLTIQACTRLDSVKKNNWAIKYAEIQEFCKLIPVWYLPTGDHEVVMSSNMLEQAELLQDNVTSWQQSVSDKCDLEGPLFNREKKSDPTEAILTGLKYASIVAGFLGTAYVVGKVAEFIPKPVARRAT